MSKYASMIWRVFHSLFANLNINIKVIYMEKIVINGGTPLNGTIEIGGMKNAALGILMAALLT